MEESSYKHYSIIILVMGWEASFLLFYLFWRGGERNFAYSALTRSGKKNGFGVGAQIKMGGCCDLNTQYCSLIALVRVN